ncbi:hypothetical protein GCM10028815_30850 [Mariniluteicoccus flavus]
MTIIELPPSSAAADIAVDIAVEIDALRATADRLGQEQALSLAGVITGQASAQARLDHDLLVKVGEFDAGDGSRWFNDIRDTAHWLAWACSMAPLTALEHVRVARALRRMPRTSELMADGRLSYSKVREVTRAVGLVDEAKLCDLALQMTAAQLARVVRTYRAHTGSRIVQETNRRFSWIEQGDGMIRMIVVLPPDEAAVVRAALDTAADQQLERRGADDEPVAAAEGVDAEVPAADPAPPRTVLFEERMPEPPPKPCRARALVDVARAIAPMPPRPTRPSSSSTSTRRCSPPPRLTFLFPREPAMSREVVPSRARPPPGWPAAGRSSGPWSTARGRCSTSAAAGVSSRAPSAGR